MQNGFRSRRLTNNYLSLLVDDIVDTFTERFRSHSIKADFNSAFDTVVHNFLFETWVIMLYNLFAML